jgi:hypothetical protein
MRRVGKIALVAGLLCAPLCVSASDYEMELGTINDLWGFNEIEDDLYTSTVSLGLRYEDFQVRLWENTFTDHENELRWDESYLTAAFSPGELWGWRSEVELGMMALGQGLLGESVQNAVHRWIGEPEVDLPYVDGRTFGVAAARLGRSYRPLRDVTVRPRVELFAAIDFRAWLLASARVEWRPLKFLSWSNEVGGRLDRTDYAPLEPWLRDSGALFETSLGFFDVLHLAWNYNWYGTGRSHTRLDLRWSF